MTRRIINIGKGQRLIKDIGPKQMNISAEEFAKTIGAEIIGKFNKSSTPVERLARYMKIKTIELGVFPPKHSEWCIGKTAATVAFVNEAEEYLKNKPRIGPIVALENYVEQLKSGTNTLTEYKTVEEVLKTEPFVSIG